MDLNQYLLAFRARRKIFLLVCAATIAATILVLAVVPRKYVATASVLLDARDEQSLGERMSPRERIGYVQTQVDLVRSGKVAKRVVRDLRYAQMPGVREDYERDTGGQGTIEDWAVADLLKRLLVDTSGSNILTITFADPQPRVAALVANGFAKAYVETSLELRTEPSREAAAWFEQQLKSLRAGVLKAQSRQTAFQRQKGIVSADEHTDVESARLLEISSQLLVARNATYDAETRYKQAAQFLAGHASAGGSGPGTDSIPEVMASPAIQAVKAALIAAQARLEQSSGDLGPHHPVYRRYLSEVHGLEDKLAAETRKVVAALKSTAVQSRRREEELKAAYADQKKRLLAMRDQRVELAILSRDVDNAQRTYDTALSRWLTNKVDSRAQLTNIALLTPAVQPLEPAQPKVWLMGGLSVLIGALLAAGVVFLLETMDKRVRSRFDLESRLAVPTLGRLSRWQPIGGRLMPLPLRTARALPHPW